MTIQSPVIDPLDALMAGPHPQTLRVGFVVPCSGPLGLTGAAALACGILAAEEVNEAGGVFGRPIELIPIDGGKATDAVVEDVRRLLRAGALEIVCGLHTSDVHRRLMATIRGRIPYIYTPPHEGGSGAAGVVRLGESPVQQLRPVMAHFGSMRWLRRWSLIGNDYIWPWAVHQQARELVRSAAADVVHEEFVPFGSFNPERLLDAIRKSRAQAVLLSLVGRDLATFNRAFHRSPLGGRVIRISCALEETGLLEVGGDSTGELYAAMGWYSSDEQQSEFAAKYASRWGTVAPTLGVYARGCYEGIHALGSALDYDGPSNLRVRANWSAHGSSQRPSVQLARADGLILSIVNSQPADS